MNTVELQGRIYNIYKGKEVTIITLFIKDVRNNYPRIIFRGEKREDADKYQKGDYVFISGSIKVRSTFAKDGTKYFEQFVRGYIIYPVRTEMSEKFNKDNLGGGHEYKNEVLIDGTIISSNIRHGVSNIIIKPTHEDFNIWVTCYDKDPEGTIGRYNADDKVCIKCMLQTTKREKGREKPVYYENLVLKYMSKIS
jgi:hypothetical protein